MAQIEDSYARCLRSDGDGFEYAEFTCMYPAVAPFYTEFEKNYDCVNVVNIIKGQSYIPWVCVGLYLSLIYFGQQYFSTRQPWNWRNAMALWNLSLSIFSWMGALKSLPHLVHNLFTMSYRDNLCVNPRYTYGSGSTGFWCLMLVVSKIPELFDTFFIVIHKKKLIFLHWYHHVTVLLYCWFSFVEESPPSIFFVAMNFSVHAIMYGYYFLMSRRLCPKWFNPMIITMMQIAQMWVGVIVTLSGFYYYRTDPTCAISKANMTCGFVMYGSYLFLFMEFFVGRYIRPKISFGKKVKSV